MTTHRAESGELINIHPYGDQLEQTTSSTLVRNDQLEVIRMVLQGGKKIPTHHAPGAIIVQCLEGAIEFESHGRKQLMRAGTMLFLAPAEPHSLEALENSSVLLTKLARGQ